MSDSPNPICCGNPACKVAETGKCIEGLELTACANYGKPPSASSGEGSTVAENEGTSFVQFSAAVHLSVSEAVAIFEKYPTHVVAIIGPNGSGKTSLIARVYELFQKGPVGRREFAGSRTLHAFEGVCHDSRCISGRIAPDTGRTWRGAVAFYHLDIGCSASGQVSSLLLADRAGEEYQEAADSMERARELEELCRADVVTLLVDGAKLCDNALRHVIVNEVAQTLLTLSQAGVLSSGHRVALVLTKLDVVRDSVMSQRAERDFDRLVQNMRRLYEAGCDCITAFKVAASPRSRSASAGEGVGELLEYWLQARPPVRLGVPTPSHRPSRAIDRLQR